MTHLQLDTTTWFPFIHTGGNVLFPIWSCHIILYYCEACSKVCFNMSNVNHIISILVSLLVMVYRYMWWVNDRGAIKSIMVVQDSCSGLTGLKTGGADRKVDMHLLVVNCKSGNQVFVCAHSLVIIKMQLMHLAHGRLVLICQSLQKCRIWKSNFMHVTAPYSVWYNVKPKN